VDDGRRLGVQEAQRLGGLGEVAQHAGRREAGAPTVAHQLRQVRAVDPVHRHDVVVAVEEVLAHERERRVRRQRQQDARLAEQGVTRRLVVRRAYLERHKAVVLAVERLDDLRLAAGAQRREHFVSVPDERQHARLRSGKTCGQGERIRVTRRLRVGEQGRITGPASASQAWRAMAGRVRRRSPPASRFLPDGNPRAT
jgi:hypothetical protein